MKKIYIVLTHTGTVLSRIIKWYTKMKFSHVSIALDENLDKMYSFGRLNPYNPIVGGFVHEGIDFGTFKRFKNTDSEVFSIEIEDNKYDRICEEIEKFIENKEKYKFNVLGLFAAGFDKKITKKDGLYCAEFVKKVLYDSEIGIDLPNIIKPDDFMAIDNREIIYQGKLRNFHVNRKTIQKV